MFCPKCGTQLTDGAKFCPGCGASVAAAAPERAAPSQAAADTNPTPAPAEGFTPPEPAYVPEYTPAPDYGNGGYVPPEQPYYGGPDLDPQPKKKSKKGLVIGLVSAVVVLAALAAAFFLWIYPSFLSSSAKYEKALNQAQTALSDEEYDDAVDFFTDALERAEDKAARSLCYVGRGDAYMGLEEYEDAIDDYEAALKLDDSQKKVWTKLADAYLAAEDTDGAIEALEDGIDATGASSLQTKLDELLQGGGASNKDTGASNETGPEPENQPTEPEPEPAAGEITLGGETYPVDVDEITLTYAGVSDISALSNCTELYYLDLRGNDISDLSPLRGCTKLEYLMLDENNISDLSALSGLTNLYYLSLDGNKISDVSPLRNLTNLNSLWLHDNDISDISALSGLRNLYELELWDNPVRDISALSPLTNLTFLDLDGTLVSDVTPLLGLTNLETLYVSGDNLPGDAWNIIAEALPQFADRADPVPTEYEYDTLFIGVCTTSGFCHEDADGYINGYAVDLGLELGDVLGLSCSFYGMEDDYDTLEMLLSGEVDLLILDSSVEDIGSDADYYGLDFSDPFFVEGDEHYCIIVRTGDDDLLNLLNEGIAMLSESGMLDELYDYWSDYDYSGW